MRFAFFIGVFVGAGFIASGEVSEPILSALLFTICSGITVCVFPVRRLPKPWTPERLQEMRETYAMGGDPKR